MVGVSSREGTIVLVSVLFWAAQAEAKLQRTPKPSEPPVQQQALSVATPVVPEAKESESRTPTVNDQITVQAAATADDSTSKTLPIAQESTATRSSKLRERISGSYVNWLTGPKFSALDGVEGPGNRMLLDQYLGLGYKFGKSWKISVTQNFQHSVNSDSQGKRFTYFNDPYVTLNNSALIEDAKSGFKLASYLRYYVPVSHESADQVGKVHDQKNGKIRVKVDPTWTVLDGLVTIAGTTFVWKPLPGASADAETLEQRDFYAMFYPRVTYNASAKFAPYLAWSTTFQHFRQNKARGGAGRWTSFNDDRNLEIGFDYFPIASLDINPYLNYGPKLTIPETTLGVIAEWTFL